MGKIARLILAFAVAFVAAGCFDYAERMEFNADGSGTLHQHMVLYKGGFTGLMEMMGEMVPDSVQDSSMFTFIKRADIEKKLENTKGVKLIDFKESQNDSTATYDIKYSFTDIEEMMSVTANMGGDEMMEGMVPKKGALFEKEATGNWKFSRDFGDSSMENFLNPPAEPTADRGITRKRVRFIIRRRSILRHGQNDAGDDDAGICQPDGEIDSQIPGKNCRIQRHQGRRFRSHLGI